MATKHTAYRYTESSNSPKRSSESSDDYEGRMETTTQSTENVASALIISASDKAGMAGLDRSKIDAIILRESADSKYMLQQRKRDDKVNVRVENLKQKLFNANPKEYQTISKDLDNKLESYKRQHNQLSATCVVVDMDMFYMFCELLTRPELKEVPACVGNGMILTSNYKARRYGVRSAMPGFIGDKLVEELSDGKEKLIHVSSHFDLYKTKSKLTMNFLKEYDPNLRSYSLDEAYLDLGPYLVEYLERKRAWSTNTAVNDKDALHEQIKTSLLISASSSSSSSKSSDEQNRGTQSKLQSYSSQIRHQAMNEIVNRMRQQVTKATGGLTCSAGIAPNFMLAKIASDYKKPNGQYLVDPSCVEDFIHPLAVRKIPGIGRVTEKILQQVCQIHTVQELYDKRGIVAFLFQPATCNFLLRASVGCSGSYGSSSSTNVFGTSDGNDDDHALEDDNPEENKGDGESHQKGISRERTFRAESSWTILNAKLEDIARLLSKDMQRKQVLAHTITVKVKLDTFDVLCKAKSLPRNVYTQKPQELVNIASEILQQLRASQQAQSKARFTCRLLGIRCSNLIDENDYSTQDLQQQSRVMDSYFFKTKEKKLPAAATRTWAGETTLPANSSGANPISATPPNHCASIHSLASVSPSATTPIRSDVAADAADAITANTTTVPSLNPYSKAVVSPASPKKDYAATASVAYPGKKQAVISSSSTNTTVVVSSGFCTASSTLETQVVETSESPSDSKTMRVPHGQNAVEMETPAVKALPVDTSASSTESAQSSSRIAVTPVASANEVTVAANTASSRTEPGGEVENVECPLCKRLVVASNNDMLNQHIDSCLSSSTIRDTIKEMNTSCIDESNKKKRKRRLTDFW